jgi:hypothetical protein
VIPFSQLNINVLCFSEELTPELAIHLKRQNVDFAHLATPTLKLEIDVRNFLTEKRWDDLSLLFSMIPVTNTFDYSTFVSAIADFTVRNEILFWFCIFSGHV